ncbi:MAG: hypothetical protein NC112_07900 [Oxalobacter formigenes]|nr:hypothetical protein [Oxalobacter formigenes]
MKKKDFCKLRMRYAALRSRLYAAQQLHQARGYMKTHPLVCASLALAAGFLAWKRLPAIWPGNRK